MKTHIRTMTAEEFKAKSLAVMDEVKSKRQTVIITKHGKPVAKLVPLTGEQDDVFGFMAGRGQILGNIVSPAVPADEWECLR